MAQEMMFYPKESTPQTVPAGDYTADFFASYAELFDLSLLTPSDGEVPLSPQSQQQQRQQLQLQLQQQQSMIQAGVNASSQYIPATIFHDVPASVQQALLQMKQEKPSSWTESLAESSLKSALLEQLQAGPQYQYYSSPLLSPPQETYTVFPPSPTPSIPDFQNFSTPQSSGGFVAIKQEYCSLPPSPPDSNGAPSPVHCSEIKIEFDVEPSIDIDSLLGSPKQPKEEPSDKPQEFHILREHLQDYSFQRKNNLKPVELESLIGGLTTRADIGSVFELALKDAQDGIQTACNALGILPDPRQWSPEQVQQWLQLVMNKYNLPPLINIGALFPESGDQLAQLTMDEFVRRIPQGGDKLHGHLELWKQIYRTTIVVTNNNSGQTPPADGPASVPTLVQASSPSTVAAVASTQQDSSSFDTESLNDDISDDEDEEMPLEGAAVPSSSSAAPSTAGATPTSANPTGKPRQGGSHIHLWQFLKELLATPEQHQSAIRWMDRTKGVFKIEDSVRVARLWGRRKNRPAMNYDKLSRSIRQYYKKGIMQKTERSQRLVYQFCHPYSL
ncbi:DNA-binding protein D-ETS-4 [Ochlerotatus camptorhynchus]|uniref:DNA-binding protein D-ETS-4 n=1 Tax=Ochlerotatus camptorhynchus TaxID=644619 RepID=UPI0031D70BB3